MNSNDFLNISVGVGFLVLVGFIAYVCIRLSETLKSIKILADDTQSIAQGVKSIKDQLILGIAKFLNVALNSGTLLLKKKGGGKHGK